jgi:hypoxia up-regulated 1
MRFVTAVLALLATTASLAPSVHGSVIGIDLGDEWFKVSIVKPGVPLDIVLNRESKRKTAALVQVRQEMRVFGNDALSLVCPF